MNELQFSLLALGGLAVAGIYAFNRFQERKFKRQAEQLFQAGRENDVLLGEGDAGRPLDEDDIPPAADKYEHLDEPRLPVFEEAPQVAEERIEPSLTFAVTPPVDAPPAPGELVESFIVAPTAVAEKRAETPRPDKAAGAGKTPPAAAGPAISPTIDYVIELNALDPIRAEALLQADIPAGASKKILWLGLNPVVNEWEPVAAGRNHEGYTKVLAGLQLADRNGPVLASELASFCESVQQLAGRVCAVAEMPDRQQALIYSRELDQFCASVDVQVGINLVSNGSEPFPGTKIRALAEAGGLRLKQDGSFHYVNDDGLSVFSLCNLDNTPFTAETIKTTSTFGITLLFDVPRAPNGVRGYEQMLMLARQMAGTLNGRLVDDNRRPLSDAGIDKIKLQLKEIYARMDARGIKAGSADALRLFS